jgi:diaminohydroxyphosphoribosylaminopyrimidine deaminase / 5-amino-6-(5-phosphoribosylamino)uracil reductase
MQRSDEYYMRLAINLALKGKGSTSPNPMVGALLVKKGKIIGRGFHIRAGFPHAEIVALDEVGFDAKGATLYVTLEPCAHFGLTPPCVNRIIESRLKEVVVGMVDPNPLNNGKGIAILRQFGIKVRVGFLEDKLKELNKVFIKNITKKLPHITAKVAQSLDGKIATRTGHSKWITSDKSRSIAHRLRQDFDGIMVGVNTVLRDDPKLNAWFSNRHPVKIIIDSQLSTPQDSAIFSKGAKVIIVTLPSLEGQETENRKMLSQKATILEVKEKDGQINLKDCLKKLLKLGVYSILVEGGGTLIGSLFDQALVDRVMFFIAPKIIGGKEAISSVMGQGVALVERSVKVSDLKVKRLGDDFLFEGRVK